MDHDRWHVFHGRVQQMGFNYLKHLHKLEAKGFIDMVFRDCRNVFQHEFIFRHEIFMIFPPILLELLGKRKIPSGQ